MTSKPPIRSDACVPLRTIRRFARRVAERFRPDRIILFGSYAYGQPDADSDVDLVVVMPARNQLDQAAKIRIAVPAPFTMDLIVRTPKRIEEGIRDHDSFTLEILSKGKILYEEDHGKVGPQSRG
jgi:predicted nucleotidyltransferase